jgi:RNA polymerase sigma-70 factor, ECF subfamily
MVDFKSELLPLIPGLRAFARSLCGNSDAADDLVQESLLRAWASQESYQEGTNLKAWIFTILRNHFYNELRKRKRYVSMPNESAVLETVTGENQSAALHLQDLARELDRLPPDQRDALLLVSVEGFSYEECARICDCAVGTIKSRVARARRELEKRLEGADAGVARGQGTPMDLASYSIFRYSA